MNKNIKSISLVSGGLDSILATRLILEQGIEVAAVNFLSPFCLCSKKGGCRYEAKHLSDSLGIELKVIKVFDEYLEMVKHPRHGYGSNMNPCIDCRILMFREAKEYMQKIGAKFIVTGEVLGQRPMSQHRQALRLIERESGLEGLILRPLSAKLMPETIPERQGWINREKLLNISGRSRRQQIKLINDYGVFDYPCPNGGCLLTDPGFSQRMKDLLKYTQPKLNDIELLKRGRHFRLSKEAKLIVGRNEQENQILANLAKDDDFLFEPNRVPGPVAIGRGEAFNDTAMLDLASSIVARYCDRNGADCVEINFRQMPDAQINHLNRLPLEEKGLQVYKINQ